MSEIPGIDGDGEGGERSGTDGDSGERLETDDNGGNPSG